MILHLLSKGGIWATLGLFLVLTAFQDQSPDARQIIERSDGLLRGETSQAEIKMAIIRPDWTREMTLKTWSKGKDLGLVLITSPARDKGTAFLKREKEVWNWQPRIDRVIKLPPSMMMQSWMGSDFTNDDLVKESSMVEDYTHRLIGDSIIDGRKCWKIEMIPLEDAPVVWGKIITWIDRETYIQIRSELFDEDGFLVYTMMASDIREMGGKTIANHLEMIPEDNPGHKTVLKNLSFVFDEPIEDNFFSVQNMKRVR